MKDMQKHACFADPPCAIDIYTLDRDRPNSSQKKTSTHTDCCGYSASDSALVSLHPGKENQPVTGAPSTLRFFNKF